MDYVVLVKALRSRDFRLDATVRFVDLLLVQKKGCPYPCGQGHPLWIRMAGSPPQTPPGAAPPQGLHSRSPESPGT